MRNEEKFEAVLKIKRQVLESRAVRHLEYPGDAIAAIALAAELGIDEGLKQLAEKEREVERLKDENEQLWSIIDHVDKIRELIKPKGGV